jgi:hypothetical protein
MCFNIYVTAVLTSSVWIPMAGVILRTKKSASPSVIGATRHHYLRRFALSDPSARVFGRSRVTSCTIDHVIRDPIAVLEEVRIAIEVLEHPGTAATD